MYILFIHVPGIILDCGDATMRKNKQGRATGGSDKCHVTDVLRAPNGEVHSTVVALRAATADQMGVRASLED